MIQPGIYSHIRKTLAYIILSILVTIIISLLATSYATVVAIAAGVGIYILRAQLLKPHYAGFILLALLGYLGFSFSSSGSGFLHDPCAISYYRVVARPQTKQVQGIRIQQFVILNSIEFAVPSDWVPTFVDNQAGFLLPELEAIIRSRGFLLKEVTLPSSVPCSGPVAVELADFPLKSFYAAHYAQDVKNYPYIDTETVTWNSLARGIRFSYIPPPFQVVRPFLAPLIGISSINEGLISVLGVLGTVILIPIFKPLLAEITQKSIKSKFSQPEMQTTKLIISEKGDEKEIKTKKH